MYSVFRLHRSRINYFDTLTPIRRKGQTLSAFGCGLFSDGVIHRSLGRNSGIRIFFGRVVFTAINQLWIDDIRLQNDTAIGQLFALQLNRLVKGANNDSSGTCSYKSMMS